LVTEIPLEVGYGLSTDWIQKTEREREGNREKWE